MRGHWSLHIKGDSGKADFSAYMTMELSDSGVAAAGKNLTDPASRSPHTHHILMTDASVSTDPGDLAACPTFSPSNTAKLVVTGPANFISGNGNAADRKSTRLNSSHVEISYAVFCLKKKT